VQEKLISIKNKKKTSVENDKLERVLYFEKKSNVLVYSINKAYVKNPSLDLKSVIKCLFQKADELKCSYVVGLGFSIPVKKDESLNFKKVILKELKQSKVKALVAEQVYMTNDGKVRFNYAGIRFKYLHFENESVREMTPQVFSRSTEKSNQETLLKLMETINKKSGMQGAVPVFLLVCGENGIFGKNNYKSKGQRFIQNLTMIDKRPWLILNPSHTEYCGKLVTNSMLNIHKELSRSEVIKKSITATNIKPQNKYKAKINSPLEWIKGKSSKLTIEEIDIQDAWCFTFSV